VNTNRLGGNSPGCGRKPRQRGIGQMLRHFRRFSELRINRPNQFRLFQAPLKTQPRHWVLFPRRTVLVPSSRSANNPTACAVECQFSITLSETEFRGQVPHHACGSLSPNRGLQDIVEDVIKATTSRHCDCHVVGPAFRELVHGNNSIANSSLKFSLTHKPGTSDYAT